MGIVSAYIELPPGPRLEVDPNNLSVEGFYIRKGEEGLHVEWRGDDPPAHARVYLNWEPRVVAIWEEEKKDESDGAEVEHAGSQDSEEPGVGSGEAGSGVGDEPTAADTVPG